MIFMVILNFSLLSSELDSGKCYYECSECELSHTTHAPVKDKVQLLKFNFLASRGQYFRRSFGTFELNCFFFEIKTTIILLISWFV